MQCALEHYKEVVDSHSLRHNPNILHNLQKDFSELLCAETGFVTDTTENSVPGIL
jgi:hypothetical protein